MAASGDLHLGQTVLPGVQQTYETVYSNPYYDSFLEDFVSLPSYTETITQQTYDRILLFGQNLDQESLAALTQPTDMQLHALVSNSLLISDLSLGWILAVLSLAGDNPSFSGFRRGIGMGSSWWGRRSTGH